MIELNLDQESLRRLDLTFLKAWPASLEVDYDGWLLRASGGYTKRANSVTPFEPGTQLLDEKISYAQAWYRQRGLDPIFRLPSYLDTAELEDRLSRTGFRMVDPTQVMARRISVIGSTSGPGQGLHFQSLKEERWLEISSQLHQRIPHPAHLEILKRMPAPKVCMAASKSGLPVAVGLAVCIKPFVLIFDLVTRPEERRKGYATALMQGLQNWAFQQGARETALQVENQNQAARHLYERLGFKTLYYYVYRQAPAG